MAAIEFSVFRRAAFPGVVVELRDYRRTAPRRLANVQADYSLGYNLRIGPTRARYPLAAETALTPLGAIVFRPPELPWEVETPGSGARVLHCQIEPHRFEDVYGPLSAPTQQALERSFDLRDRATRACLDALFEEVVNPAGAERRAVDGLVDTLVVNVHRYLTRTADDAAAIGLSAETIARIEAFVRNASGRVTPPDLAAELDMPVRTFQRRFLERTGMTIGAWLDRVQMDRAAALLRDTGLPLKHIAWQLGYAHASNFATAFRRHHGESPSAFRRRA